MRSLHGFDPSRGSLETWLWKIGINVARDAGRASTRAQTLWDRIASGPLSAAEDEVETLALRRLNDAELLDEVARLPRRYRSLIALRFGGDLSYDEIAQLLGEKPAAVRQAMRRALKALRIRLKENMNLTHESIDRSDPARRLAKISIPGSDKVLDRTLAIYSARSNQARRRPWRKPGLLLAAVLASLVAGSAAIAASGVASDQALGFVGLAPRDSGRIQNVVGSATSFGQTVQVLGAYGDATRTVVFRHTTAGGPVWATLSTDSGQDLSLSGGGQIWERDGAGAIAFGPSLIPTQNAMA